MSCSPGRCQVPKNALGSAPSMHRTISVLTAVALLSAGCAPRSTPARDATSLDAASPPTLSSAHLVLADAAPAPPPPPAASPAATPETKAPDSEAHGSDALPRAMGWFSLSFGIASAAVAIGTSIMMVNYASQRSSDCNAEKLCSAAGLNANAQLQGLQDWNLASYIAAAAGIGIGAFLILTNPADGDKRDKSEKKDTQTAIGVSPTGSGASLVLRGTF